MSICIRTRYSRYMSCSFFLKNSSLLLEGDKNMEQQKIGKFLKELRKEKNLTQEQFAEIMGVSNRSVSRWETGSNLPDLDILIQIADYYDVELREILDGERKTEHMDKEMKETVLKVADYSNQEKSKLARRIHYLFIVGVIAFIVYMVLELMNLTAIGVYEFIASYCLGLVFGILLVGVLFTSKYIVEIKAFKERLLKHEEQ